MKKEVFVIKGGKRMVKVECIVRYIDNELSEKEGKEVIITPQADNPNFQRIITPERAEVLLNRGFVKVIEVIPEQKNQQKKQLKNK